GGSRIRARLGGAEQGVPERGGYWLDAGGRRIRASAGGRGACPCAGARSARSAREDGKDADAPRLGLARRRGVGGTSVGAGACKYHGASHRRHTVAIPGSARGGDRVLPPGAGAGSRERTDLLRSRVCALRRRPFRGGGSDLSQGARGSPANDQYTLGPLMGTPCAGPKRRGAGGGDAGTGGTVPPRDARGRSSGARSRGGVGDGAA